MICNKCKRREATRYYKMVVNGVTKEEALCAECDRPEDGSIYFANDIFHGWFDHDNIFDSFGPMFGSMSSGENKIDILKQAKKSVNEGANQFKKELSLNPNFYKLKELKQKLNEAIEKEDYERASDISKEMRALEGKGEDNV